MDPTSTPTMRVSRFLSSHWTQCAVYQFAKMNLADEVQSGLHTSSALGAKIGVAPDNLYRLLRSMTHQKLLVETSKDHFELTPDGELLLSTHPLSLRDNILLACGPVHMGIWSHFDTIFKGSDKSGYELQFGMGMAQYLQSDPEYSQLFKRAMTNFSDHQSRAVVEVMDLSGVDRLVDVAGGQGFLSFCLLQKYPELHAAVVLDRPPVIASAAEAKTAHTMGVADRVTFEAGDMFVTVPTARAYVFKLVLHDFNDEQVLNILRVVHRDSAEGVRLFVADFFLDETNGAFTAGVDLHLMVLHHPAGCQRTPQEFEALLNASGWKLAKTERTSGVLTLMEAHKA